MKNLFACLIFIVITHFTGSILLAQSYDDKCKQISDKVYSPKEVDKRAIATSKPEAILTEKARRERINGIVKLQAILTASKRVENIEVIEDLPDGLTEAAIEAAHKLKFKPAMKDGCPVSVTMQLYYYFNTP